MKKNNIRPPIGILIRWASRLGTGILLVIIVWGCGAVPELRESPEGAYVRLPFVRVLLASDSPEITIACTTPFALECMKRNENSIYHSFQPITFRQKNGLISISTKRSVLGDKFEEIIVIPRGRNGLLDFRENRYHGMFKILPYGFNLRLINIVHIDDYLKGVVPPEIGNVGMEEFEAVKAQAVAARTYSMSHLSQYKDEPFDMKSDVSDQLYHGVEVEEPTVSRAIDETRGYVVQYDGQLINAYYHSTCGGYTDDIDEVWDKPPTPYLRSVDDSGFCSWSKYYEWKESYTAQQLRMMIEQYLSAERGRVVKVGDIIDMYIRARTVGGRIAEISVKTTDGDYSFRSDRIRWVFKRSSNPELILQSARFKLRTTLDDNGMLVGADFIGSGYGHGVGMCQCGAIGMARAGWKCDDILTFYYKNSKLTKLY